MKRIIIYSLPVFLFILSCKEGNKTNKNSTVVLTDTLKQEERTRGIDTCMAPAVYEAISSYVNYYVSPPEDDFYSVYFSRRDTVDYFTIWCFLINPKRILSRDTPKLKVNYAWFQIDHRDVILITRQDDKRELPFKPCINQLGTMPIDSLDHKVTHTAPKTMLIRTYKYYFRNGRYEVEPSRDTIFLDFFKNRLDYEMEYLKHENRILEQRRKDSLKVKE